MRQRRTCPSTPWGPVLLGAAFLLAAPAGGQDMYNSDYVVATDYVGTLNYISSDTGGPYGYQQFFGVVPGQYYTYGGGALGDFDDDGDLDFVIASGYASSYPRKVWLYRKIGPGAQFASPIEVGTWDESYYAMDIGVADFNEDGKLDFVLVHYGSPNATLYLGNGTLTFNRVAVPNASPNYSIGVAVADFNSDGHADFVSSSWSGGGDPVRIAFGTGNGTFQSVSLGNFGGSMWSIGAGDFDEDGDADILLPQYGTRYLGFLRGNGDGTFQVSSPTFLPMGSTWGPNPIKAYDFNHDGHLDLVTGESYDVRYYPGRGDGTFAFGRAIGGGAGYLRYGLAVPPQSTRQFRISEVLAQRGAINVLGGAQGGVLPGIGEFLVRLICRGYGAPDLSTLSSSLGFAQIQDAQHDAARGEITLRLTIPSFSTAPGDYALSFSVTTDQGATIQTSNVPTVTVLAPADAANEILSAILDLLGQTDSPAFIARINGQILSQLTQLQQAVEQLYADGFTSQGQELLACLQECQATAEGLTNGQTPSDAAQTGAHLQVAANLYESQVVQGVSNVLAVAQFGAFQNRLQALSNAGNHLAAAADAAYDSLRVAISALQADNGTLAIFVYEFAQTVLSANQAGNLTAPAGAGQDAGTAQGLPPATP